MSIECPIECIDRDMICGSTDFLEKHSTFVITFSGIVSATIGGIFTYFLKSRCTSIKCCCVKFDRDPIPLSPDQITIEQATPNPPPSNRASNQQ